MASNLEKYTRLGLNIVSTATSLGFSAAKAGTKLGFGITRGIATTVAGVAGSSVDFALLGGAPVIGPVLGGTVSAAITVAEKIALAPIILGETLTSTSFVAAESSIDVVTALFPGSDEASFSLASFVSLVKRERSRPILKEYLPEEQYSVTEIAKALVAWAALQSVTSEFQENRMFEALRDADLNNTNGGDIPRSRKDSTVHITSDTVSPGNGEIITADIGQAKDDDEQERESTIQFKNPLEHRSSLHSHLKADLRRFSKMVLGGYGGAGLLFFGVSLTPKYSAMNTLAAHEFEAATLADAINASEEEAQSTKTSPSANSTPNAKSYSWWNVLLGRHDKEIFEGYALAPSATTTGLTSLGDSQLSDTILGNDKRLPRYWILTDHSRRQVVLVFRGTMSLNELAVDLTCDPVSFSPGSDTSDETNREDVDDIDCPMPGALSSPTLQSSHTGVASEGQGHEQESYQVHGGMLRMARMMGEKGKPVHRAVRYALVKNKGFDLVLCGHSLGAGVAALLALTWADPRSCRTVHASGLPPGRLVKVFCYAPPCLVSPELSRLSRNLITSFAYSCDIVTRLSLGSVRDITRASAWLCNANHSKVDGKDSEGYSAVTYRAMKRKTGFGEPDDVEWFLSIRKTLEANMQMADLFPPGQVFWAVHNNDLLPIHRILASDSDAQNKLRLFEVVDNEKMFGQILFSKDMLSSHLPHTYDRILHEIL